MTGKKKIVMQIIIFTLLAFIPTFIIEIFFCKKNAFDTALQNLAVMLNPAAACILTRIITKDKDETFLKIKFHGNGRYYLYSILSPFIPSLVFALCMNLFFVEKYNFSETPLSQGTLNSVSTILMLTSSGIINFFVCWGEEFGWRGYLTPKLKKLFPRSVSYIISGIIWGLWHAPLIARGFNFGKDYKFFPYGGIIAMCISCIILGTFLSWLTEKTGSILPASLCHAVIDSVMWAFAMILIPTSADISIGQFGQSVLMMVIGVSVMTTVIILLDSKMHRKKS